MLETLNSIKNSLDLLLHGFYYIFHPGEGCKILFIKFADKSYDIALIVGMTSIFLYM